MAHFSNSGGMLSGPHAWPWWSFWIAVHTSESVGTPGEMTGSSAEMWGSWDRSLHGTAREWLNAFMKYSHQRCNISDSPEQDVFIVRLHNKRGRVVAMWAPNLTNDHGKLTLSCYSPNLPQPQQRVIVPWKHLAVAYTETWLIRLGGPKTKISKSPSL